MKKIRIGLTSFTCDEGCSIAFLEVLNKKFADWEKTIDITYSRILRGKNELKNIDIMFVEGSVSTQREVDRLKEIRKNTKKLVAIGTCAVNGSPSNIRNFLSKEKLDEIKPILKKFKYRDKVTGLNDVVKVDDIVPGCPMDEEKFIALVEKYIKELK